MHTAPARVLRRCQPAGVLASRELDVPNAPTGQLVRASAAYFLVHSTGG